MITNRIGEAQLASTNQTAVVLNAFEITNINILEWPVAEYQLTHPRKVGTGADIKAAKDVMWKLIGLNRHQCPNPGFVVPVTPELVIVPGDWTLPDQNDFSGFSIARKRETNLLASEQGNHNAVIGILQAGIREFMRRSSQVEDILGPLWQDFNGFCESPSSKTPINGIQYCRRFEILPTVLRGNRWVLRIQLNTTTIDSRPFSDYYEKGEVATLWENIESKRINRLTRKGRQTGISVLRLPSTGKASAWILSEPDIIETHSQQDPADQKAIASQALTCENLNQETEIPLNELFLVMDTQITGSGHSETILGTELRSSWFSKIRQVLNGADVFGTSLLLANQLTRVETSQTSLISLPALRIKTGKNQIGILPSPKLGDLEAIEKRGRDRQRMVQKNGYLITTQTNPVLAVYEGFPQKRADQLVKDLNQILRSQGVELTIGGPLMYKKNNLEELNTAIANSEYNAAIVVLPEGSTSAHRADDTHERIKKTLGIESQCIQHDKTLHKSLVGLSEHEIHISGKEMLARRASATYKQVLLNLLVKKGWIPFLPSDPFSFNVHVGIDVGGQFNNRVMACIGYGLSSGNTAFFPQPINSSLPQAEPIRDTDLYQGLKIAFEQLIESLNRLAQKLDFERVLFFRDGDSKGQGDDWQEMDGIRKLHADLLERKIVSSDSVWVALEVSKRSQFLRQMRADDSGLHNPIVGTVSFPFEQENHALVSTTGAPYSTQGTAIPLVVKIHAIYGAYRYEDVLQDLIWEADLGLTKLDMGTSLPFVLRVADTGALQLANSYQVTGISI
jgi:hypothetical protein